MDLHRLSEERSLAYHRVIAARLRLEPQILEEARRRAEDWSAAMPNAHYAHQWREILSLDGETVANFLVDRGELATELRQSSPFAGALSPRERWQIWRDTREALQGVS